MIFYTVGGDDRDTKVLRLVVHSTRVKDLGRRNAGTKQETRRRSTTTGERRG